MLTTRVLYTCAGCGLKDVPVDVPARGAEDVRVWMDATVAHVSKDHRRRSYHCRKTVLQELKVPITGRDRIGGAIVQ